MSIDRDRLRRLGLLLAILIVHTMLLLHLAKRAAAGKAAGQPTLRMVSVTAEAVRPAAPPADEPPPAPVPTPQPPAIATIASAAPSSPGAPASAAPGDCAWPGETGLAIAADPAAMAEIDALPPGARTSADVVMLWDGCWLDPATLPGGIGAGALRRTVERVVGTAPAVCRDAPAAGPRFIPVAQGTRTITIVVGSGLWRWADLMTPSPDCPASANQ